MNPKFYVDYVGMTQENSTNERYVVTVFKKASKTTFSPSIENFEINGGLATYSYLIRGSYNQALTKAKELAKKYPIDVVKITRYFEKVGVSEPFKVTQI